MKIARWFGCLATLLSTAVFLSAVGCGKGDDKAKDQQAKAKDKDKKGDDTMKDKEDEEHGWWCQEHGIVEEDCSLCLSDAEVKKRFKDTGDWCKIHKRAQSQCFHCDPGLYEKVWEPKYVAKYGKKPERPPESEFKKKG